MRNFWKISAVLWAILIFRLTTSPQLVVSHDFFLQQILMMGAHLTFFGIQAVLVYLALPGSSYTFYFSLITTSIYGLLIELIQRNVPGRTADPVDWLIDTLGAVLFIWIMRKYEQVNIRSK